MKLQHYIQYYIGRDVIIDYGTDKQHRGRLVGGDLVPNFINQVYYDITTADFLDDDKEPIVMPYNDDADEPARIKPILRRLEDVTEEEKTEVGKLFGWYKDKKVYNEHHLAVAHDSFKELAYDALITANDNEDDRLGPKAYFAVVPYLCRQGFDLFGLIDAGLAIDAKTINP